ncbi:MAG: rhodanese-like domain-containing protein [Leptolyngbyaceae cyanobacterium]
MSEIPNAVAAAQELANEVSPAPATFERKTTAEDLKARLDWGEPALTIIDVRDRESFNNQRIQGAIHYAEANLVEQVKQTLETERDIYIYADSESAASSAATKLDEAGFEKVAILQGGLQAWSAVSGPIEGRNA